MYFPHAATNPEVPCKGDSKRTHHRKQERCNGKTNKKEETGIIERLRDIRERDERE